ncbi:MAG: DUF3999 family protein [Brevundimonas sp.]|jgi:hypothetical protein|nr:DUF3999 family protein [Brevundimonas sp.]
MIALRPLALAALALLAACGREPARDPARPESYARQWTVTPAAGTAEQQLALPAEALPVLKTGDLADVRLFDATGRALPLACLKEAEERTEVVPLTSWPVLATATPREAGVALTIGPDKVARVVGLAGEPGQERQVALLVDTRQATRRALAVRMSVNLPLRQPVTVRASASNDLKTWEPLGEKTLFRTDAAGNQLEIAQIPLGGIVLKDRYLQITWDRAEGVTMVGAQLVAGLNDARPSLALGTLGAVLQQSRELRFTLPPGHSPDAVRIALSGNEGVLPVELYSRATAEQPWRPMLGATLRSGRDNRLPLDGAVGREFRLVADARTAGFATMPRLTLEYAEVVLLTRFSGQPPYRLAAGLATAPRSLLASADIIPGNPAEAPRARVTAGPVPALDVAPERDVGPLGGRKAVLWLALLAGVGILVFAVLRLLRKAPEPSA